MICLVESEGKSLLWWGGRIFGDPIDKLWRMVWRTQTWKSQEPFISSHLRTSKAKTICLIATSEYKNGINLQKDVVSCEVRTHAGFPSRDVS